MFTDSPIAAILFKVVATFGGAEALVKEAATLIAQIPGIPEPERRALADPNVQDLGVTAAKAVVAFEQAVAADLAQ